jgi:hypothetical protein
VPKEDEDESEVEASCRKWSFRGGGGGPLQRWRAAAAAAGHTAGVGVGAAGWHQLLIVPPSEPVLLSFLAAARLGPPNDHGQPPRTVPEPLNKVLTTYKSRSPAGSQHVNRSEGMVPYEGHNT